MLQRRRQILLQLLHRLPRRVQHEGAALLDVLQHVVLVHERRQVAADVVRRLHRVLRLDRLRAEAHVRHRQTARLVRVEAEVRLRVQRRVVHDQLHRLLRRAHRAVRAQAVQDALLHGGGQRVQRRGNGQRGVAHVVLHAQREVLLGARQLQVVEHGFHQVRRELLARNAELAADHLDVAVQVAHRTVHVQEQRLRVRVLLAHLVQHADLLHRLRQRRREVLQRERSPQVHLHHAHLLAVRVQVVHRLLRRRRRRAHHHHHVLRVRSAHVVEQVVLAAAHRRHLVHRRLHLVRHRVVERLVALQALHPHVVAERQTDRVRVRGVHAAVLVLQRLLEREDRLDLLGRDQLDRRHLVRRAEAVEEVHERNAAIDRRQMRHQRQIVRLLHGVRRQVRKTRRARLEHVAVVAVQAGRHLRHGAARHVDHTGQQLARNLVHAGHHQHQTLGRRERRAQQTSRERAVQRSSSASLGLHREPLTTLNAYFHLGNDNLLTEDVLQALVRPGIAVLSHSRGRSDGEQHGRIGDLVNGMSSGFITINGHSLVCTSIASNNRFGKGSSTDTVVSGGTSHGTFYKSIKHLSAG